MRPRSPPFVRQLPDRGDGRHHSRPARTKDTSGVCRKSRIEVTIGQTVHLRALQSAHETSETIPSTSSEIPVSYPHLARDLRVGSRILINDGLIELVADRITDDVIACSVVTGGTVTSHKGINLPDTAVSEPTLTEKDRKDLRFGVQQAVDYIALSFVRGPEDINTARAMLKESGGSIPSSPRSSGPRPLRR